MKLLLTSDFRRPPPSPPSVCASAQVAFMERARANLGRHSPRVLIPKIYPNLSSTSILTQVRRACDSTYDMQRHTT